MRKTVLIFVSFISLLPTVALPMKIFPVMTQTVDQIVRVFADHEQLSLEEQHDLRQQLALLVTSTGIISIINQDFLTTLAPFVRRKDNPLLKQALCSYIKMGYSELAQELIQNFDLDLNALLERDEEGSTEATALCLAVVAPGENSVKIIECLLRHGADTQAPGAYGYTPLGCAACSVAFPERELENIKKKIALLLAAGANLDSVNQEKHSFFEALDNALDFRREQVAHLKDNHHAMYHWQRSEEQAKKNIESVRAMPEIVARIAVKEVQPFFTGIPGVSDHILGYAYEHIGRQQNEREFSRNEKNIDQNWPEISEAVESFLPARVLPESRSGHYPQDENPVDIVGDYLFCDAGE